MLKIPKHYDVVMELIRDRETGKYFSRKRTVLGYAYQEMTDQHSVLILDRIYNGMARRGLFETTRSLPEEPSDNIGKEKPSANKG